MTSKAANIRIGVLNHASSATSLTFPNSLGVLITPKYWTDHFLKCTGSDFRPEHSHLSYCAYFGS